MLDTRTAADSTPTSAASAQPQKDGGQMPHPKSVSELTLDEFMELPWVKRMSDAMHESRLKQDMREFSEEFLRLSQGRWARLNDIPYWKIALGSEEEKLVDEALKVQRERKYEEPRAVVCGGRQL